MRRPVFREIFYATAGLGSALVGFGMFTVGAAELTITQVQEQRQIVDIVPDEEALALEKMVGGAAISLLSMYAIGQTGRGLEEC